MDNPKAVSTAIDRYGGRYKFAKDIGVTWRTVNRWYRIGYVPVPHVEAAAKLLKLPAKKLNARLARVFA